MGSVSALKINDIIITIIIVFVVIIISVAQEVHRWVVVDRLVILKTPW